VTLFEQELNRAFDRTHAGQGIAAVPAEFEAAAKRILESSAGFLSSEQQAALADYLKRFVEARTRREVPADIASDLIEASDLRSPLAPSPRSRPSAAVRGWPMFARAAQARRHLALLAPARTFSRPLAVALLGNLLRVEEVPSQVLVLQHLRR
jgi:hypothetical protein